MSIPSPVVPPASMPFYLSKIFWLNVLMTIFAVAALFTVGGQFADMFTPIVVKYIMLGVAVLNIILRLWLTQTATLTV